MADVKTDKEPSIEEILESIRQIISEDGTDAAKPAEAQPAPAAPAPAPVAAAPPPPPPAPAPAPMAMETILDLTEKVEVHTSDLDLSAKTELVMTENSGSGLLSDTAASASAAAMAKLLDGNVAIETDTPSRTGSVTLEDMAKDLLRPLIKTWLDQNLPGIIEKMVQKEIEKISRRAGG